MWFNFRDIPVSDRLRSRRKPGDRVAQAISVDRISVDPDLIALGLIDPGSIDGGNPPTRDVPYDAPLRGNRVVHAEYFQFTCFQFSYFKSTGECELADGWSPYPAGR